MSESDEGRPLSRRERRLREMAEAGMLSAEEAPVEEPRAAVSLDEPEISPLNPDGTPRSRRELRELREQALAERRQAEEAEFDLEKTQAFSLEDIEEATATGGAEEVLGADEGLRADEGLGAAAAEAEAVETEFAVVDGGPGGPRTVEAEIIAEGATTESLAEDAADDADLEELLGDLAAPETEALDLDLDLESVESDGGADAAVTGHADARFTDDEFADDEAVSAEAEVAEAREETVETEEPETEHPGAERHDDPASEAREPDAAAGEQHGDALGEPAYSFPDITPLDEGGSVFDDPAVRVSGTAPAQGGDFDDLISRAVAQEGAASPTNASALILPDMGHTGQLSGPLGETGELFITGSIELPKSLGETGGHSALLDSVQGDPDEFALGEAPASNRDSGIIAPVSAARAVSARSTAASVVAAPEKEKSRLPIALIATGGGLLVVIAGLGIWAAATGFFA